MSGHMDGENQLECLKQELGGFGPYQRRNLFLLFVIVTVSGLYTITYAFTAEIQNYRCLVKSCDPQTLGLDSENIPYNPTWLRDAVPFHNNLPRKCNVYKRTTQGLDDEFCEKGEFLRNETERCDPKVDLVFEDRRTTIANDFNLLCEENYWALTLVGTIHNVGQFFSMILTGIFSDKFGRRTALATGVFLSATCGLIRAFSPTYTFFVLFEFLDATFGAASFATAFILAMEPIDSKYRVLCSSILCSAYCVGESILAIIAQSSATWQSMLLIAYLPGLLSLSYFWIIPESLLWLLSQNKCEQFEKTVQIAARTNNLNVSMATLASLKSEKCPKNYTAERSGNADGPNPDERSILRALTNVHVLFRVCTCSFLWITCTFVYFGLQLHSVALSGNVYMNFICGALIEIPGYFMSWLFLDRFGRRLSISGAYGVMSVACFALTSDADYQPLKLACFLTGKCAITMAFASVYVFTAELYPTPVRHSLLGFCSMIGRVGSIIAPQMPLLANFWQPLPMILFGSSGAFSALLVLWLPETLNTKLPETLDEAIKLKNKHEIYANKVYEH